jgi:hypothetical protein
MAMHKSEELEKEALRNAAAIMAPSVPCPRELSLTVAGSGCSLVVKNDKREDVPVSITLLPSFGTFLRFIGTAAGTMNSGLVRRRLRRRTLLQ